METDRDAEDSDGGAGPVRPRPGAGIAWTALALFASAPAFHAVGYCTPYSSEPVWLHNSDIVFFGWMLVVGGVVGWFANVAFAIAATALIRGKQPSIVLAVIHLLLLADGFVMLQPVIGMEVLGASEAAFPICRLGLGFWLWTASNLLVCATSLKIWHAGRTGRS